ncbi:hypothetical protein SRIMM317S_06770 [Streptomyces rimosus subsp. rimosus]
MSVHLDHTIVHATDKFASARFLAELAGLDEPTGFGPFAIKARNPESFAKPAATAVGADATAKDGEKG